MLRLWGVPAVQIQDTPGYGDNLNIWNNIVTMKRYVEDQNQRWLRMEMDKKRIVDPSDVEDPRVDLCIFCLQPHRLRPIDLRCGASLAPSAQVRVLAGLVGEFCSGFLSFPQRLAWQGQAGVQARPMRQEYCMSIPFLASMLWTRR